MKLTDEQVREEALESIARGMYEYDHPGALVPWYAVAEETRSEYLGWAERAAQR